MSGTSKNVCGGHHISYFYSALNLQNVDALYKSTFYLLTQVRHKPVESQISLFSYSSKLHLSTH